MSKPPKGDWSQEALKGTILADAYEQSGRQDIVRVSGVTEESGGDVYQTLVDVSQKAGVDLAKEDISVLQITNSKTGARTIIAMFVWRKTKHSTMDNMKNWKRTEKSCTQMTMLRHSEIKFSI